MSQLSYVCPEGHDVTAPSYKTITECPCAIHSTAGPKPLIRIGEGSRKANAERQEVAA